MWYWALKIGYSSEFWAKLKVNRKFAKQHLSSPYLTSNILHVSDFCAERHYDSINTFRWTDFT